MSLRRAPRAKMTQDIKSNPDSVAAMEKDRAQALETIRVCCAYLPELKISESMVNTLFDFVKDCTVQKDAVNALNAIWKSSYLKSAKTYMEKFTNLFRVNKPRNAFVSS